MLQGKQMNCRGDGESGRRFFTTENTEKSIDKAEAQSALRSEEKTGGRARHSSGDGNCELRKKPARLDDVLFHCRGEAGEVLACWGAFDLDAKLVFAFGSGLA